jgi:hypothetical protein
MRKRASRETTMSSTRKTFLLQLASGGGLLVIGCGGGGDSTPAQQAAGGGCSAAIAANHGHVLTIAAADLNSTTDLTYDIQGSATHNHKVTFSAAQLAQLKAGTAVTVTTFNGPGHEHSITESCM